MHAHRRGRGHAGHGDGPALNVAVVGGDDDPVVPAQNPINRVRHGGLTAEHHRGQVAASQRPAHRIQGDRDAQRPERPLIGVGGRPPEIVEAPGGHPGGQVGQARRQGVPALGSEVSVGGDGRGCGERGRHREGGGALPDTGVGAEIGIGLREVGDDGIQAGEQGHRRAGHVEPVEAEWNAITGSATSGP
jgi:hypothetical protein